MIGRLIALWRIFWAIPLLLVMLVFIAVAVIGFLPWRALEQKTSGSGVPRSEEAVW